MRWGIAIIGGLAAALAASTARAQNRSFCAERPGMGTPACTLGPGQAMVEVTVLGLDHTASHTADASFHLDAVSFADTLLRYGLDDQTEIQIGVTGYIDLRFKDRFSGARVHANGVGDSYVAVRRSLSGLGGIAAVEAYVTLPTGDDAVSAGTWGAGVVVPIDLPSPGPYQLSLTPEVGVVPDADREGRHLQYGAVLGVSGELAHNWGGGLEISAVQDDEPEGSSFTSKLAGTVAWQASKRLQLNAEVDVAIVADAPRAIALLGFALRL